MRTAPICLSAAVLVLALAGCGPLDTDPAPSSTATGRPTASATPSTTPSSTPAPTPTPEPSASSAAPTPLAVDCTALVSLDQMYEYSPSIALVGPTDSAASTPIAEVVAQQGTACQWVHESNGLAIVAGAALPGSALADIRAAAASGTATDAYGSGDSWFAVTDGVGTAQTFQNGLWVVVSSPLIAAPDEAAPLVNYVLGNLG